jgi:hypothetical protein
LARVPSDKTAGFQRLLAHAITRAQKDSAIRKGKRISVGALSKDFFAPLIRAAEKLQARLERLQGALLACAPT